MGQSMISCADLEALLLLDSDSDEDEEDDTEEEENNDVVVSALNVKVKAKVSRGLFGIKTQTATKSKTRMGMKKLGKSVRKMIIK
eukprot:scaffold1304_cov96-Skeletonema_dohrnii-CCMP3373.AAC.1